MTRIDLEEVRQEILVLVQVTGVQVLNFFCKYSHF